MSQAFHWPDLSHLALPTCRGPRWVFPGWPCISGDMTVRWFSLHKDMERADLKEDAGNRNENGGSQESVHDLELGGGEREQKEAA